MTGLAPRERDVGLVFHLDTNRINARGQLEYVNQLEAWDNDEVILLELSEAAQREALAGNDPRRRRKVFRHIVSLDEITSADELGTVREIAAILSPEGAETPNERNDIFVVFNAQKYGAILITGDGASRRQPGGILGSRERLKQLGVRILTDEEAVQLVRDRIAVRDRNAIWWSEVTGNAVPDWVGRD